MKLRITFCGLAQAGIFTTKLSTKPNIQIYEKLSYEARQPPLRQTAVTSWRSVFSVLEIRSDKCFAGRLLLLCRLRVGGFKNFKRKEILKNNFSVGKGGSSFAIFGLSIGLCELQMCLQLWVGFFVVIPITAVWIRSSAKYCSSNTNNR